MLSDQPPLAIIAGFSKAMAGRSSVFPALPAEFHLPSQCHEPPFLSCEECFHLEEEPATQQNITAEKVSAWPNGQDHNYQSFLKFLSAGYVCMVCAADLPI